MSFSLLLRVPSSLLGFAQFKHNSSSRLIVSSSSMPFEGAAYQREIEAAINVVERACTLCSNVRNTMMMKGKEQMNKSDQTPVTVADFGVQSLISMELGLLFPSIPLVAEEDARFLRMEDDDTESRRISKYHLLDNVVDAVSQVASIGVQPVERSKVLEAIDRGGESKSELKKEMQAYWVLDPIDGTRGFLKGGDALYVIGLALVVDGKLVLGVMGCPCLKDDSITTSSSCKYLIGSLNKIMVQNDMQGSAINGIVMAAYHGFGCWVKLLESRAKERYELSRGQHFIRCRVDRSLALKNACFGLSDHESWETSSFAGFVDVDMAQDEVLALKICCGSLCKYLSVAIGAVSVVLIPQTRSDVKAWDHASGVICVLEAGGKVTDADGLDLEKLLCNGERAFLPGGRKVIVTNGHLHETVLGSLPRLESK